MLRHFETTVFILLWCVALSVVWAWSVFRWTVRDGARADAAGPGRVAWSDTGMILPALALAPLAVVAAMRVLGINLLYPVRVLGDWTAMVPAAIAPATVLVLASGLAGVLAREIRREAARWVDRPFVLLARATGRGPVSALRRLVLVKALGAAWARCLPWIFGELLVVEVVFNAPGLGLDAWHMARIRDAAGLVAALGWIVGLYVAAVVAAAAVHAWIGRRLDGYA